MARNKNMRRRHNDVKIDMIPKWLRILMIVIKGSLVIIPFIISSIAMFYEPNMGIMESGIWNCIWMFSLLHMISYVDEK
tara:strand:- start:333 stop:569 length:237 start_codon:yes stop_codon:yes gene_type:complete